MKVATIGAFDAKNSFSDVTVEEIPVLLAISLVVTLLGSMVIIPGSRNIASKYPGRYVHIIPVNGGWNVQFPWKNVKFRSGMVRFTHKENGQGVMKVRLPFSICRIYVEYPFFDE